MKRALYFLPLCLLSFTGGRQEDKNDPEFLSAGKQWVDSVFNSLTPDQRIGQLFMVAAYSNQNLKHVKQIHDLIVNYNIGGLIWMQGGPMRQGKLANYYQSVARTPLLYSIDGEWGLAMRLDSTPRYPKAMALGAIRNDQLIYRMGRQIALECRRIGIHVNFAPVADVNNNPDNPVIGIRSFGEDKRAVARKAMMYMKGMQEQHVMANGKHFPGHGDTDSDSHMTLPFMKQSVERLDSLELYPFRELIGNGLSSVMVAHLSIPSLDSTPNLASTLSPRVVKGLLREKLGFKGLVFTDALSMKGVTKFYKPGEVDVAALKAGNDVLLFSEDVPRALAEIKKAIAAGDLQQDEVDEHCKRVLHAKYWCGLRGKTEIVTRNLVTDLNTKESAELIAELTAASLTLLKNDDGFLPLKLSDSLRVAEVSLGEESPNGLAGLLGNYTDVRHVGLPHDATPQQVAKAFETIRSCDMAVVQLNRSTLKATNNYGVGEKSLQLMDSIARLKPSALVMMTNPYLLNKVPSLEAFRAVMVAYEYTPPVVKATGDALLGFADVDGRLPVSTALYKGGAGTDLRALPLARRAQLTRQALDQKFSRVDSLAQYGISEKAYPGCQVVALYNGQLVYQKSFGRYTYDAAAQPVDNGTMYDLASLTKIASSSLALMRLAGEGKFDYKRTLGSYLPYLAGTNKDSLAIEEVLTHQAGLQAWIPFYQRTLERNGDYKPGYYSHTRSEQFPTQVAEDLFVVRGMHDTIYKRIADSKLEARGKYLYSDLGYYFIQQVIEQQTGQPLDIYVHDLYAKIGIGLRYHPLQYFSKLQVAPTENDTKFRKQLLQGYVHDPGAALLGGVAGHAGLFGNALDMAHLMQFYLNKGELNGVRLLDSNVVNDFTSCHFCPGTRRGLCFDKPEPDATKESPVTADCSLASFGHSGFTGTFAWADPRNNLVVVFLSNRVYPSTDDNKLAKLGIRGRIHKAFYDALRITP